MVERRAVGFGAVLRVREFRALWAAELVSVLGDQLARVALAWLVFSRTSSAVLTALTYALTFVPSVLGGLLLSGLADRYPRRRVLIATDLVRAGLAAVMALPGLALPVLWAAVGLLSFAGSPFKAAQLALLPHVVADDQYAAALSVRSASSQTAQLVGFAAGGFVLVVVDPHLALGFNAVTFVISAVVVWAGVRVRPAASASPNRDGRAHAAPTEGGQRARLLPLVALTWLIGLYVVPEGIAAPYAHVLGMASVGLGVLMAADPVGSVIGAWLTSHRNRPPTPTLTVVLAIGAGVPLLACALRPGLAVSAALWAVSGALSTAYLIQVQTLVKEVVPDHRRGRVLGRLSTYLYASQGLAILAGGVAVHWAGPFRAVALAGGAAVVLAALIGLSWRAARPRNPAEGEHDSARGSRWGQKSLLRTRDTSSPGSDGTAGPGIARPCDADPMDDARHSMTADPVNSPRSTVSTAFRAGLRAWKLWTLPVPAVAYLLTVETAAVAVGVRLGFAVPAHRNDLLLFAVIVVAGVVTAECTHGVERMRRRFTDQAPHVNMSSVWTLAAALVTTPALAAATAVVLYAHLWWRSWRRITGMSPHRVIFSVSVVALSCYTASLLVGRVPGGVLAAPTQIVGTLAVVGVLVAYWTVNSGLLAGAIALSRRGGSVSRLLGSWGENSLEFATLVAGVFTAVFLQALPGLVVLVPVLLIVLHRSVLVRQLEHAVTTDRTTGLLNAASWHSLAETEFDRAGRHHAPLGLLMIDVDDFGQVNQQYGDSVGDAVLRVIAHALRDETRSTDLCGRLSGEEFVVLLADTSIDTAAAIADRICQRVRALRFDEVSPVDGLRLTVSIGLATYPHTGTQVRDVLMAADNALFAAKDAGRDQVHAVRAQPSSEDASVVADR